MEELARRTGLHPLSMVRALRLSASFGVFREVTPGIFAIMVPRACSAMVQAACATLHVGSPARTIGSPLAPSAIARNRRIRVAEVFGQSFWDHLRNRSEDRVAFNLMLEEFGNANDVIVNAYNWAGVHRVVDVGGGSGSLLAEILIAKPDLSGVLIERPDTIASAVEYLAARGVSDRCRAVGSSFFDSIPAEGDVWILSQILHNWNDEDCRRILRRCKQQMRPEGRLFVIEMVTVPCKPNMHTSVNDISMLVLFGEARQRTEDEYHQLVTGCELVLTQVIPTRSRFSIIECQTAKHESA